MAAQHRDSLVLGTMVALLYIVVYEETRPYFV